MTITSILLDEDTFSDMGIGLSELPLSPPLEMRGIGKIVVLAGPNGAGKSRLLRLIPKLLSKQLESASVEEIKRKIRQNEENIKGWTQRVDALQAERSSASSPDARAADQLKTAEENLAMFKNQAEGYQQHLRSTAVMSIASDHVPRCISFVPKNPNLVDPFNVTESEAAKRADYLSHGTVNAEKNAPAYARRVLRLGMEQEYQRLKSGLINQTPDEKSRDDLIKILEQLLGSSVKLELKDARLLIGDIESYSDALSPGQQILFQFGCLLHAQSASLSDCIILMDEPENHLHPAVLAQVVDTLRDSLTEGQLWIATHSVPLIAQLMSYDNDCLWFVNGGRVKRSGRSPEHVLDSLMGGRDGSKHLHNLTLLPAQYAAVQFLTECLDAPGVVGADIKDPQTRQITKIIRQRAIANKAVGKPLRVLDFGAGKGRLLATLRSESSNVLSWLDYYAYDIDNTYQQDCEREIAAAYGDGTVQRWYSNLHTLAAQIDEASIDIVVMCNVLHEIDPDEWLKLFSKDRPLNDLLCTDGYLLVVEDYGIPTGERAHRYGFLLLDEPELCKLFEVKQLDRKNNLFISQTSQEPRYRNRLTAHLIGKECVSRITEESRRFAIIKLHERMAEVVSTVLQNDSRSDSNGGRLYARSAQLLANAWSWISVAGGSANKAAAN